MNDDDINTLSATCEILIKKQQTIKVLTKNISQLKIKYHELQNQIRSFQSQQNQQTQSLENCIKELQDQSLSDIQENQLLQDRNNVIGEQKDDKQIFTNQEHKNNFMHLCNSKIDWIQEIQQDNVQIIKYFRSHPKQIIGIAKDNEKSLKYGRAVIQKREKFTDKQEQLLMIQLKNSELIQNQQIEQEQNQQIEFINDQLKKKNIEQYLGMDDKLLIKNHVTITKQAQCKICRQNFIQKNRLLHHFQAFHKEQFSQFGQNQNQLRNDI